MDTMNPYNLDGPARNPGGESCLSTPLIRSQLPREIPARLVFYPEGSLATAVRELVEKECAMCGGSFKVEKYRSDRIHICQSCRGINTGGRRGAITRFSETSRRCLMHWLNKVKRDALPLFCTLTYPDEFAPYHMDSDRWKRDLRAFELRFRRQFPDACFIWRLEVVDRKSGEFTGELFPHFHLLTFGCKLGEMRSFIAEHWHDIAGQGSEEHLKVHSHKKVCTPVISRKGIMRYASKTLGSTMSGELGKTLQTMGKGPGRWWGIIARKTSFYPYFVSEERTYDELLDKDAVTLIRYFRKKIHARGRSWRSLTVFIDGQFIVEKFQKMIGISPGKWYFSCSGRRYDSPPFWEWAFNRGMFIPSSGLVSSRISTLMKERKLNPLQAYKFINLECPGLAGV